MAADTASAILIVVSILSLFYITDKLRSDHKVFQVIKQFLQLLGLYLSLTGIVIAMEYLQGTAASQVRAIETLYVPYFVVCIILLMGLLIYLLYEGGMWLVQFMKKAKWSKKRR